MCPGIPVRDPLFRKLDGSASEILGFRVKGSKGVNLPLFLGIRVVFLLTHQEIPGIGVLLNFYKKSRIAPFIFLGLEVVSEN